MQAEIMFDMIREWPRYVKVPFPIAKVKSVEVDDDVPCCIYAFPRVLFIFPLYSFFYWLLLCITNPSFCWFIFVTCFLFPRNNCIIWTVLDDFFSDVNKSWYTLEFYFLMHSTAWWSLFFLNQEWSFSGNNLLYPIWIGYSCFIALKIEPFEIIFCMRF